MAQTDQPTRKKIRLEGYDYSTCGAYFVTICSDKRQQLFWNVNTDTAFDGDTLPLSEIGLLVQAEVERIGNIYPNVIIDCCCIMPNHIHLIVGIVPDENGCEDLAPSLSRVIKQFKGAVSKRLGHSIWQKSFSDEIIRNEMVYHKVRKYIDDNPAKWREDSLCQS